MVFLTLFILLFLPFPSKVGTPYQNISELIVTRYNMIGYHHENPSEVMQT